MLVEGIVVILADQAVERMRADVKAFRDLGELDVIHVIGGEEAVDLCDDIALGERWLLGFAVCRDELQRTAVIEKGEAGAIPLHILAEAFECRKDAARVKFILVQHQRRAAVFKACTQDLVKIS